MIILDFKDENQNFEQDETMAQDEIMAQVVQNEEACRRQGGAEDLLRMHDAQAAPARQVRHRRQELFPLPHLRRPATQLLPLSHQSHRLQ